VSGPDVISVLLSNLLRDYDIPFRNLPGELASRMWDVVDPDFSSIHLYNGEASTVMGDQQD
jgi:hypothetical protein